MTFETFVNVLENFRLETDEIQIQDLQYGYTVSVESQTMNEGQEY